MLNLVSLIIGVLTVIGIARYNKSHKLFLELILSLMIGFACGQIGKSYLANTNKKSGITVVTAMQPSKALTISDAIFTDAALPDDICVLNESSYAPVMAKVALAENNNCRDIIPTSRDHVTFNADNDIGSFEPVNTS